MHSYYTKLYTSECCKDMEKTDTFLQYSILLEYKSAVLNSALQILHVLSCKKWVYQVILLQSCLKKNAVQLLAQALVISHLDYCNPLLAGLPASVTKPLQCIQNPTAHLVFSLPLFSHVTPLLCDFRWLPVAARIQFKTMVLAFKDVSGTAPFYLQTLVRPHALAWALRSTTSSGRLVLTSLGANKGCSVKSQIFSVLAPQWWNELQPMSSEKTQD